MRALVTNDLLVLLGEDVEVLEGLRVLGDEGALASQNGECGERAFFRSSSMCPRLFCEAKVETSLNSCSRERPLSGLMILAARQPIRAAASAPAMLLLRSSLEGCSVCEAVPFSLNAISGQSELESGHKLAERRRRGRRSQAPSRSE